MLEDSLELGSIRLNFWVVPPRLCWRIGRRSWSARFSHVNLNLLHVSVFLDPQPETIRNNCFIRFKVKDFFNMKSYDVVVNLERVYWLCRYGYVNDIIEELAYLKSSRPVLFGCAVVSLPRGELSSRQIPLSSLSLAVNSEMYST